MDIDFLKFICDKSENYHLLTGKFPQISSVIFKNKNLTAEYSIREKRFKEIIYRDILNKAFYAILNESDKEIYLTKNCIKIYDLGDKEKFYTTNGFETAIEEFLMYMYKREGKFYGNK